MFAQTWRQYWGMNQEPFMCEDADKDVILQSMDKSAVHSGFDRIYGNPNEPAPGIIFGEKGSGKSALRLMMRRNVEEFNEQNPEKKIFLIEYTDFNQFIGNYCNTLPNRSDEATEAKEVISKWKLSDHLDCILSLGYTKLVDQIIKSGKPSKKLQHKHAADLLIGTSMYYHSEENTTVDAVKRLSRFFGFGSLRPLMKLAVALSLSFISVFIFMFLFILMFITVYNIPLLSESIRNDLMVVNPNVYYLTGLGVFITTWIWYFLSRSSSFTSARRAARGIKTVPKDPKITAKILLKLPSRERKDFILPKSNDEAARYDWLQRFITLINQFGYHGIYVVVDRLDEPSQLSGRDELMKQFIDKMLDIKFLQYPHIGIKLFLPIELDSLHRNASPEQLKRMRLDKSNLIPEFKWSGQELYEIANQRMQACIEGESNVSLADLFGDDLNFDYVKETLNMLGTPRYAFGFLSSLVTDYVKDLPNDLPENDPRWKINRNQFDVARANWLDRTGVLRRVLNG